MKHPCLLLLALLTLPAAAAPVHVALKSSAAAAPNADGFITLGSVATLSSGDKAARTRFAAILVARAPLPGETRQLTRGDLALKLRQAGINPDTQAVLEGADRAEVTTDSPPALQSAPLLRGPNNGGAIRIGTEGAAREEGAASSAPTSSRTPPLLGAGESSSGPVIHSGDAVTIYIQSGPMTITAPATARESGKIGDTIRVHRDGVMTDLSVQVLDAQTVQMEI